MKLRKTGIEVIGDVPWGTHFCQFYQTKEDLLDILLPYFKAGLENNEFCMWVTSEPLNVDDAKRALKKKVKALDDCIKKGQIEILDYSEWYTKSGRFCANEVLKGWEEKEKQALTKGFDGLRLTGNTLWLEKGDWKDFTNYEAAVNNVIGEHQMLAVCTYCLDRCSASEIIDVMSNHQFALIKREGKWEIIESAQHKETSEALRLSEERFRQVAENIREVFWLYDLTTNKFVYVSSAYEFIMGRPVEILYKDPKEWIKAVYPDDRKRIEQDFAREQEGVPFEDSYRIVRPDGSVRWINDRGFKVYDDTGRVYRIAGIAEDITERRHAEEAVRSSQHELRISNRIAEIFLTSTDDEMYSEVLHVLLEAMESRYGIFGYIRGDDTLIIPSMTRDIWDECQVPDKTIVFPHEKWGGIWGRTLVEKRSLFANEGLHVPEGHVPITRVLVVPIMYSGRVIGVLEVANKATDYTHKDQRFLETMANKIAPILHARLQRDKEQRERKQAEEALRRSEERYALAQRAAEIGSWDWNILTGALTWSETIEPMFGFRRGEFGRTYDAFLNCVHPEDRKTVTGAVDACAEGGEDYMIEHRIIWPDSTVRWVSETGDVIRDESGKAIRMLGIIQDITERKDAERRLELHELRLQSLLDLYKMGESPEEEILDFAREEVIKVTESKFAFIGFLSEDESAMTIDNWSKQTMSECAIAGKPMHFPIAKAGLWGEAVRQRKPVVVNDYEAAYAAKKGYPEGHVPVKRFLCIPVFEGKRIVAVCGVANKESDYDESDIDAMVSMMNDMWRLIQRKQAEEAQSVLLHDMRERVKELTCIYEIAKSIRQRQTLEEIFQDTVALIPSGWHYPEITRAKVSFDGVEYVSEAFEETEWKLTSKLVVSGERSGSIEVYFLEERPMLNEGPFLKEERYLIDSIARALSGAIERKRAEENLRRYRQHLEELVKERTIELTEANKLLLQEIEGRKRLEKEILEIGEREQRRIGQELHDSIGQQFTGIAFMTKVLARKLSAKLPEEAADATEVVGLVNRAMDQTRSLAKGLHPVDLDADSLTSILQELAATTEKLFGIRCTFKCDGLIAIDDAAVAVHLYRMVQEAINNAIKHGHAKNINIGLTHDGNKSVLTVQNDGLDFPGMEAKSKGMGLQIMDHRAEMIGGSLDIKKAAGGGTIVTCEFANKKG